MRSGLLETPRGRALAACALLVLLGHGALIGGLGRLAIGPTAEPGAAAVSVRTIAAAAQEAAPELAPAGAEAPPGAAPAPAPATPAPDPKPVRRPREPAGLTTAFAAVKEIARARIDGTASAPPLALVTSELATMAGAEPGTVLASSAGPSGEAPSLLVEGERPPPVYRTRLPPSATLRYQVRRGFLRGTGEIRWQASDPGYRLVLEARIAGLVLLVQTSEGAIDVHGLAPRRFLDQRVRRPAQAANFRRDIDRITFSGPAVEWPLLPGSQDRLSWMIQLAGIAAAEPGHLVEGGRIAMVVVGARGEAGVWTLRSAGREDVETASGTVHAVKLVREGHSLHDTHAEIWLDPERDYLPARATLHNGAGAVEYDLVLERIEPAS